MESLVRYVAVYIAERFDNLHEHDADTFEKLVREALEAYKKAFKCEILCEDD